MFPPESVVRRAHAHRRVNMDIDGWPRHAQRASFSRARTHGPRSLQAHFTGPYVIGCEESVRLFSPRLHKSAYLDRAKARLQTDSSSGSAYAWSRATRRMPASAVAASPRGKSELGSGTIRKSLVIAVVRLSFSTVGPRAAKSS
jgi:hypothetical protein